MRNGTAVQEYTSLSEWDFSLGKWHRSKDKKQTPGSDFASFMINKKWWLEEQFNVHMMRFQQVTYLLIKQSEASNVSRLVW